MVWLLFCSVVVHVESKQMKPSTTAFLARNRIDFRHILSVQLIIALQMSPSLGSISPNVSASPRSSLSSLNFHAATFAHPAGISATSPSMLPTSTMASATSSEAAGKSQLPPAKSSEVGTLFEPTEGWEYSLTWYYGLTLSIPLPLHLSSALAAFVFVAKRRESNCVCMQLMQLMRTIDEVWWTIETSFTNLGAFFKK